MAQQTTIADVIQAKKKLYANCLKQLEQSFIRALECFLDNGPDDFTWQVKYNDICMNELGKKYNLSQVYFGIKIFLTELQNNEQSFIKDFKIEMFEDRYICIVTIDFNQLAKQLI